MTAAARRITRSNTPLSSALLNRARQATIAWQESAWGFFDDVPEIHFAHEFLGNAVGRMRLFPQIQLNPTDPPLPLDPEDENLSEDLRKAAAVASATLDRLNSSVGGIEGLQTNLGINTALVGEVYLWGHPDEEAATGESWEVLSTREVRVSGESITIYEEGSPESSRELGPLDDFIRIWHRHPAWRIRADSPMRPLLSTCEELLLLQRSVRAVATSRIAGAGVLKVPDELTFVSPSVDGGEPPEDGWDDPLLETLLLNMTTPIMDPDSAAAVVPMMVKGPAAALGAFAHLLIERPFDPLAIQLREECVTRLARGLDIPPEILLGLADVNHWSAWQVQEQTFKAHIEPLVDLVDEGLTVGFLQPILHDAGIPQWADISIGKDSSALVGHPNEFPEALQMHEVLAVSDAFLRSKGGAGDNDAPDDVEYSRRLAEKVRAMPPEVLTILLEQGEVIPAGTVIPTTTPVTPGQPLPETSPTPTTPPASPETTTPGPPPGGPPTPPATTAAVGRRELGTLLAQLDRALVARVLALADTTVTRAVEIVGARVVRAVNGSAKTTDLRDRVREVPLSEVAMVLGRDTVHSLGIEEMDVLDAHLGSAEHAFTAAVTRTRKEAKRLTAQALGDPSETWNEDEWDTEQDDNTHRGWLFLLAGMTAVAAAAIWDQRPTAPPVGEIPVETRVPSSLVRDALAQAGGVTASPDTRPAEAPAGEVALGDGMLDYLSGAYGANPVGWRWDYGDPSARTQPFEPHENLDGVEFTTWDDPLLANSEGWPDVDYYQPQDHDGCLCAVEIILGNEESE